MISVEDENEFTVLFGDLIKTMALFDEGLFELYLWISGSDLPFKFCNSSDFHFMQEGIKIISEDTVHYIFYDTITYMKVVRK